MGYSRKEEIAKRRQQRREAKASKKRKERVREKLVRFLIVCEGTKTEPHYFEALIKNYISTVRDVTIEGEGRATVALVDKTLEIKQELERKNAMSFDRVWVVFDKDELWYYLHFEYLDTGIGREAYIDKLQDAFRKKMGDDGFKYRKGNPDIYSLLQQYGREDLAKRFAKQLRALHTGTNYAMHKPCTMVDKLVEELEHPERLLE